MVESERLTKGRDTLRKADLQPLGHAHFAQMLDILHKNTFLLFCSHFDISNHNFKMVAIENHAPNGGTERIRTETGEQTKNAQNMISGNKTVYTIDLFKITRKHLLWKHNSVIQD